MYVGARWEQLTSTSRGTPLADSRMGIKEESHCGLAVLFVSY